MCPCFCSARSSPSSLRATALLGLSALRDSWVSCSRSGIWSTGVELYDDPAWCDGRRCGLSGGDGDGEVDRCVVRNDDSCRSGAKTLSEAEREMESLRLRLGEGPGRIEISRERCPAIERAIRRLAFHIGNTLVDKKESDGLMYERDKMSQLRLIGSPWLLFIVHQHNVKATAGMLPRSDQTQDPHWTAGGASESQSVNLGVRVGLLASRETKAALPASLLASVLMSV